MLLYFVLLLPVVLVLLIKLIDYRASSKFKRASKEAKHDSVPTIGIVKSLADLIIEPLSKKPRQISEQLRDNYNIAGRDNKIYHKFLGPIDNITIVDADAIKTLLLNPKSFPKYPLHLSKEGPMARFAGRNLAFIDGDEWRAQRHVINPAFYNLSKFLEPFDYHTKKCLDIFAKKNGQPIQIPQAMTDLTIDILGDTVIGTKFGAQDGDMDRTNLEDLMFLMAYCFQPVRLLFNFLNKLPTKANSEFEVRITRFNKFIESIVKEAETKIKNQDSNADTQQTLLDLMILSANSEDAKEQGLHSDFVKDNAVAFFIAGHETTSSALGFEFYRLSKHPDVQQRLYEEIQQTFDNDFSNFNADTLHGMVYLDAFIKECMRLHPPAAGVLGRINLQDVVMCGYHIPKGTMISPDFYDLHYNEQYYGPTVNQFRPERFIGEEGKTIPRFAHLPFSAGARVCIGNNFSILEQKVYLVRLLSRFEILANKEYQYKLARSSILQISEDFTVCLRERK